MLVKSVRENDHLSDLQETFNTLRLYNMKLNPSKCVFRVTAKIGRASCRERVFNWV